VLTLWMAYLVNFVSARLRAITREESGQGLTEYALIIALIAVVVIGAIVALGGQIKDVFNSITNCLSNTSAC
jgi:pilus assembly protein Flp/PilA